MSSTPNQSSPEPEPLQGQQALGSPPPPGEAEVFSQPPTSFWHDTEREREAVRLHERDEQGQERDEALRRLDGELRQLRALPLPQPKPVSRYALFFMLFTLLLSTRDIQIVYQEMAHPISLARLHSRRLQGSYPERILDPSPERTRTLARVYDLPEHDVRTAAIVVQRMITQGSPYRPGLLDWGVMIRFRRDMVIMFEYNIFLNMLYAAGLASVLFLRNRDITNSRLIDRQNRELSLLNRRKEIEVEETSSLLRVLNRAQTRLLAAERLASIGRLSATLAHEIRNPLGIIASSVGMVAEDVDKRSPAGQALELVRDEIDRLNKIITDLLNFARPRPPQAMFHDLNELLRAWTLPLEEDLSERNIQLLADLDPALPEVYVDADQLYQAVLNLILNASEATDPKGGGRIVVSTHSEGGEMVMLDVRDDGEGIEPSHLPQVFEPFFTTKTTGSGLGLAVVKQVVEAMGGEVEIESTRGEGTKVGLRLPTRPSAASSRREGEENLYSQKTRKEDTPAAQPDSDSILAARADGDAGEDAGKDKDTSESRR